MTKIKGKIIFTIIGILTLVAGLAIVYAPVSYAAYNDAIFSADTVFNISAIGKNLTVKSGSQVVSFAVSATGITFTLAASSTVTVQSPDNLDLGSNLGSTSCDTPSAGISQVSVTASSGTTMTVTPTGAACASTPVVVNPNVSYGTPSIFPLQTTSPTPPPAVSSSVTLYRVPGDPRVYVIKDGKKHWIKTAEEFNAAGYKWSDISEVAAETLVSYPEAQAAIVTVKINTPSLRIRTGNSATAKIIGYAKEGEIYTIIDENSGRYKIKTKAGIIGWILGTYATPLDESAAVSQASTVTILVPSLRVRSLNNSSGKVLSSVRQGEKYSVIEENSGWLKIKTSSGVVGWVMSQYAAKQ